LRARNVLASAAILAILCGLIWLEYLKDMEKEEGRRSAESFFDPGEGGTDAIDSIDLIGPSATVSVSRSGEEWRLTAPLDARADEAAVASILSTLGWLRIRERMDSVGSDLAGYGLDPPEVAIVLHRGDDGAVERLEIGAKAPVGSARYARRAGEEGILLVSSSAGDLIGKSADDLRYRSIVGIHPAEIRAFSVRGGGSPIGFERDGSGWRLTGREEAPALAEPVTSLLMRLSSLKADGFAGAGSVADAPVLGTPDAEMRVVPLEGAPLLVSFARDGQGGGWRARRDDMDEVFLLEAERLGSLDLDRADYLDRRIVPLDLASISTLSAAAGSVDIHLAKDSAGIWRLGSETGPAANPGRVGALLDLIASARADELVAPGKPLPPLSHVRMTIRAGSPEPLSVAIGAPRDGSCLASSTVSTLVYRLPEELGERIFRSLESIEPLSVEAASPEAPATGEGSK
jgi:hypothetical protein